MSKEIEKFYETPDPWGYQTCQDDLIRKYKIIDACRNTIKGNLSMGAEFDRALDIGCGEGWITMDLPARHVYGYELSDNAKKRWHPYIHRFDRDNPTKFDLVVATGILYTHYNYQLFFKMIQDFATDVIVTCNIAEWERPELTIPGYLGAPQIHMEEFPYREFTQRLRVFKK